MRSSVFALSLGLSVSAIAQDLDRLLPDPVPPQVEAPETAAATELVDANASAGGDILLERLNGIVIGPSPAAVAAANSAAGLTVVGAAWLDTPDLREGLTMYFDRPVDQATLHSLPTVVRLYAATLGFPFSIVYLPEQDITDGVLRLVVVRSELDTEIAVEGARYFSAEAYRAAFRLKPGAPLAAQDLQSDVAWINRNPFRAATLEARAGDKPGTTQLVLKVRETRPVRVFVSADNTGTLTTQEERVAAGLNWGNAFGLGHQLSAQWNSSWDFETLRSGSGSYVVDLPWRHTLSLSGAYSRTNGLVAEPFALKGTSWQIGANYDVPLADLRSGYTHSLQLGLDFKASDNNFTFASIPITDNLTHVAQARLTYSGRLQSALGVTSFRATLTGSPGGLTDRNETEFFNVSRAGARADYIYLRASGSHVLPLDGIKAGLAWTARGQMQFANHNLIGSEQFGGGGAYSVRGYEEGEVYKDNGVLLSHELRLPPFRLRAGHTLQLYGFQDYANLWSTDQLPGERTVDLHSIGAGLDYSWGSRVSLRAAHGWQLTKSGSSETGKNSRLHISANLSF